MRLSPFSSLSARVGRGVVAKFWLLTFMVIAMQLCFASWMTLLNNFAVSEVGVSGREIGIQQSIREIPGFLALLVIFITLLFREQVLALVFLALTAVGVAMTGLFTSFIGFYISTFVMSLGFHYFETINQSLSLQWLPKKRAPQLLGRIAAFAAAAQLIAYAFVFFAAKALNLSFVAAFATAGLSAIAIVFVLWLLFPKFENRTPQLKKLILRKRYWLYYALTFMSGARRQIFVVFAGFLMVEKFGFAIHDIAALYFINGIVNLFFMPVIGRFIARVGERTALLIEYGGLIVVFLGYALVSSAQFAIALYLLDHALFSIVIALKTYFQKIAAPEDLASSAGVAFTINHIAAVFIPAAFGLVWIIDHRLVFISGAAMALVSLVLALWVPRKPCAGNEVSFLTVRGT